MTIERLTMDNDWSDLCNDGIGEPADVETLFDNMARTGFDATTWDYFWCGTAMYHSKRYPLFKNAIGWKSAQATAAALKRYDPLALALKLGKERNIKILPYTRLMEEAYAPFDGDEFFRANPHYWWQTRSGQHRMVGWPCYNYPEVREHLLDAYGWFLLTVSEPAVPLAQPPHSVAELPEVAEGKAIAGEVREFQQLEQAGWLAELLASQDAMPAQRSSRSPQNLAQAAPAQSGLQQFGDWAVQLEALFDRMGDSLDEY